MVPPRSMRLSTMAVVVSCGKRGAPRIGALGRILIDLMGNAVIAKLEAAVVLADGLGLLDFGPRSRCKIALDLGVEDWQVVLGEQVVGPGIQGRLGDGDLAA